MAKTTGVVLAVGGITAANELLFAPLAGSGTPWKNFNWRVIPATGVFALAMAGLETISPQLAMGLSITALVTVLFASFGKAPPPVTNLSKALGYGG
jgi:hypothetical protein